MKISSEVNIKKILNLIYVQKNIIIMVALVIFTLTAYLASTLPDVYRSSTSILWTPQELPSSVVNSRAAWSAEQRIRAISQDILSRDRLMKIVEEFNLYPALGSVDTRVDRLRRSMVLEVRRNDTFVLSFEYTSPQKAKDVASRMGGLFIEENMNLRQSQATGTTDFISTEALRLRKELEEQEAQVNIYKARYRTELPEQLDANLRTLEQLRAELQSNTNRLSTLQERKATLEKQLVEGNFSTINVDGLKNAPEWKQLADRRSQLDDLKSRYSEKHPDIVRLKKEIARLEAQEKLDQSKPKDASPDAAPPRNPVQQMLLKQTAEVSAEINSLKSSNDVLRGQISSLQAHIDNTPVRAMELAKISRVYDITVKKYQDLQAKSFDTRLSENMDKGQKGEQFRVVEKANTPQRPVGPNRLAIVFIGLMLALASGFGVAFLLDNVDSSFRSGEDIRENTALPLLATIPAIATRDTVLHLRKAQRMWALASLAVVMIGIISIHFYGKLYF